MEAGVKVGGKLRRRDRLQKEIAIASWEVVAFGNVDCREKWHVSQNRRKERWAEPQKASSFGQSNGKSE